MFHTRTFTNWYVLNCINVVDVLKIINYTLGTSQFFVATKQFWSYVLSVAILRRRRRCGKLNFLVKTFTFLM